MHPLYSAVHASLAKLPVSIFCAGGGFAEELIFFLPSPLVMGAAGAAAFDQQKSVGLLFWLAVLGALGKTAAAFLLYEGAQKMESSSFHRFGSFLGISQGRIKLISSYFSRSWKDFFLVGVLRMLPVVPSTVLSAACGVFRTDRRDFLTATFAGSVLRNYLYLCLGYQGIKLYESSHRTDFQTGLLLKTSALCVFALVMIAGAFFKSGKQSKKENA